MRSNRTAALNKMNQKTNGSLALFGGAPVRKAMLQYGKQTIEDDDIASVTRVLKSDFLTRGPAVEAFERHAAA